MDNKIPEAKLYRIGMPAAPNMYALTSPPFFYWDVKKFRNDEVGTNVFFISNKAKRALYVVLEASQIVSDYNSETDKSTFSDNGKQFEVKGEFAEFVKFRILETVDILFDWEFSRHLGSDTRYYLYKPGIDEPDRRIEILRDLRKIFHDNQTINQIDKFIALLGSDVIAPTTKNTKDNRVVTAMNPKQIILHAHSYITSLGFRYQYDEVANFYLSLRAKPFVILAGISGTGKSQLPRKFAASLGFGKEQVILLPVRPDWTDSSDLLGYTSLDGTFIPKDLTTAIQRATANPTKPYFFILDEMNLARVEHYFSDFLSIIETRERVGDEIRTDHILREEILKNAKNRNEFKPTGLPQNLFLIGTVNMDETTHAFSKKVLDRANSIEMNDVDLSWINSVEDPIESLTNISHSLFQTVYLTSAELTEVEKTSISEEMLLLQKVNKILQRGDLHFAYRVRDEIAFYLLINKKHDLIDDMSAFDFQLVQKVLPRLHGSSERVQTILVELLNLLEGEDFRTQNFEYSLLDSKIDFDTLKYRRASKKIIFMLKRFDEDRFTSFWL